MDWIAELRAAGLVSSAARLGPIAGGVSSEIYLVEDGPRRFVIKSALGQLKVKDDWFADPRRNQSEQDYFAYVGRLLPGVVPRVLHSDPARGWFAMEFIDGGMRNWKAELLAGRADPAAAARAGEYLGHIHRASWEDPAARSRFDTLANFTQLRIAPYLLTTAERVPELAELLRAEAARLGRTRLALVHGDYSPKNILVAPNRLAILDAEVAWFGDPAFDMGFLLNHFHLKALYHATADASESRPYPPSATEGSPVGTPLRGVRPAARSMLELAETAWSSYAAALGPKDPDLEARTARLVLCLMLARIHGKSPVEYLTAEASRRRVGEFVHCWLPEPPASVPALVRAWGEAIARPAP